MTERDQTQPAADVDDKDPVGEMELPGRGKFGARAVALLGSSIGLGVVGMMGDIPTSPPATL